MRRRLLPWMAGAAIVAVAAAGLWASWGAFGRWRSPPVVRLELLNPPGELNAEHPDAVVQIVNRGNVAVEIHAVTTTCGCSTTGPLEPSLLKPGDVGRLSIHGDTRPSGQKRVHIVLETDHPELPRWTFTVQIRGQEPTPPFVTQRFRDVELTTTKEDEDLTAVAQVESIENALEGPWITRVSSNSPDVEISEPRVIDTTFRTDRVAQRTYQIQLRFPAAAWPGESLWTGEFRIETRTEPAMPTPLWRFVLQRESPIAVHPDRIFVAAKELAAGPVQRTVRLWRRDGAALRLEQWSASGTGLVLEPSLGSDAAPLQVVRVTIDCLVLTGTESAAEGSILLHTNDPAQPMVALPVYVAHE